MQEFAFELALCARIERPDRIVARQLGAGVRSRRVADVVRLEPGPAFERRTAITADTIPPLAVESDVGPGRARPIKSCFDCHPEHARDVVDRAVEAGFFERERRNGRTYVRQTARYPDDWFDRLVGIENKPDLDRPGDLADQLRTDVSLGLFDEVVLATASYVTGAHLNRLPDPVGVWRFDPDTGERDVVREPTPLDSDGPGIELLERDAARAEIRPVTAEEIARKRRRLAERAYGKGWRTYDLPACARCVPDDVDPDEAAGAGLPWCTWKGAIARPVADCGPDCDGYEPADPPDADADAARARRSAWDPAPAGVARRQSALDRFAE